MKNRELIDTHLKETLATLRVRFHKHERAYRLGHDAYRLVRGISEDEAYFQHRLQEARTLISDSLGPQVVVSFERGRLRQMNDIFEAHRVCLEVLLRAA